MNKQHAEEAKASFQEKDRLQGTNEFLKKKCMLYQRMVYDANRRAKFELPTDKKKLQTFIDN